VDLINYTTLETLEPRTFQDASPFPWLNPHGVLTEAAYRGLIETLPPLPQCDEFFGKQRKYGQQSHNRYVLEYEHELDISPLWQAFINELESPRYLHWLAGMLGTAQFRLSYHWHYAPSGCSVSPHCDSRNKLGSHIFYMNTSDDWQESWGGATVVLDGGDRFLAQSAPAFEDFDAVVPAQTLENYSFLFRRRGNSWHGVPEIHCPEGRLRKVFIVVIEDNSLRKRVKRWRKNLIAGSGLQQAS
jgi:hypothetical protein